MRSLSRFIPGEQLDSVARWDFDAVDYDGLRLHEQEIEQARAAEQQRLEQARQDGHAEGFAQGREHGRNETLLEAQRQMEAFLANQGEASARQLAALLTQARAELDAAQEHAAQEVLELACALAREVLRHEIASNPNALLPVLREGLSGLFDDSRNITVKLNPIDLDMLQDTLRAEFPNLALAFQAEPAMARGGCQIESAGTVIDGTLQTRWARAVGRLGRQLPWDEEAGDDA